MIVVIGNGNGNENCNWNGYGYNLLMLYCVCCFVWDSVDFRVFNFCEIKKMLNKKNRNYLW